MAAPGSVVFCEDNVTVMRRFPKHAFDLILGDPPFDIGESSKDHKSRNTPIKQRSGSLIKAKQTAYEKQDWDNKPAPLEYYNEIFRVGIYIILKGENYLDFPQKKLSSGRIFWHKFTGNNDYSDGEMLWTNLHKTVQYIPYMWNGMFQGKSLAEPHIHQPDKRLNEIRIQNAHTPVLFWKAVLHKYAKPGFKILSTHTGSGSCRIACYDMGYDYVGCENNRNNWLGQEKRFSNYIIAPDMHRGY